MRIRVGFSADPDDAFMYWGIASGAVDTLGLEFEPVTEDIQTLNEWAREGRLEVTAMSLATYPLVQERYLLLPHGASIGSGYGPVVVAREPLAFDELRGEEIVVPGTLTTAYLVLRMALGPRRARARAAVRPRSSTRSRRGGRGPGCSSTRASSRIRDHGLAKCLDLGEWWLLETGLPLPLGVNTIRRDLGAEAIRDVSAVLRASIEVAFEHREEALDYALGFGRGLDGERGDRFVGMYVNELTRDVRRGRPRRRPGAADPRRRGGRVRLAGSGRVRRP